MSLQFEESVYMINSPESATSTFMYDESLQKCMEYFHNDKFAAKAFLDKYALRNQDNKLVEQTPNELFRRVAKEIARIEKNKFKTPMSEDEVFGYLSGYKKIIVQGSPSYGIGNPYQYVSLSNCFVVDSPLDSYGSICQTDQELVQIAKRRGGGGVDLSNLRPCGTATTNAAKTSSGVVSFARRFSNSINEVGQFGRRGALMISLSIHHPDVLNFITAKTETGEISGANISIRISDEFMEAVKKNKTYQQRWPIDSKKPTITKDVNAKEVWDTIIKSAHANGEPGLLFWDHIISESPADCYSHLGFNTVCTNPCGELPLCPNDSCRLLAINAYTYVKEPFTNKAYFDFKEFYHDAQVAQRIQDDIIDLELESIKKIIHKIKSDPEPEDIKRVELNLWIKIQDKCSRGRRTGTGPLGIADAVAAVGYKYGSPKSIDLIENIYKTLKLGSYRSSVDMAKELGPFSMWDPKLEKHNPYLLRIKQDDAALWEDMQKYGRRNIGCLTSAPTGTTASVAKTTPGIEPLFYILSDRMKKINANDENVRIDFVDKEGIAWQKFQIPHYQVETWSQITGETDIEKSPWFGCTAHDVDSKARVKIQAAATRHVDHAISSTVNLREDATVETVATIYETAWAEKCKGITVYREGSRNSIISSSNKKDRIMKTEAPKRPKALPCDIHHTSVKGEDYFVLVGLYNGEPYEVFAGKNGTIKKSARHGFINKVARGKYDLLTQDGIAMENIAECIGPEEESMTRSWSAALRHGCEIRFLVEQLEKSKGDLWSLSKATARSLKKYIADGVAVSGASCESCGGSLIRQEGCPRCPACGWTKCS